MHFIIENETIGLRLTLSEEVEAIYTIESREENSHFVMAYSRERHQQVIEGSDEQHLTIWDKETNELVGFVILAGLTNANLSVEFRRLVISSKGKGHGRKTVQLLKQYCFCQLLCHRMWLDVYEDNIRAIALYRSEGFLEEGTLREVIKHVDAYRSLLLFSMLESEFAKWT